MKKIDSYRILEETAFKRGCPEAKVVPVDKVVVEDRVRLRCMIGCPHYGKGLRCPPYTPSIDEFRKILNDYSFAMVVKLKPREIPEETLAQYSPENNGKVRLWNLNPERSKVTPNFSKIYMSSLMDLLELERAAFKAGYVFATVFFAGRCMLCEKCNVENGECHNPTISRPSAEAMGINMLKTAENAGINLKFDTGNKITPMTPMAILLID